jgi:hypothetical protein
MAGGRKETVSDREILQIFYESPDPFLSTKEVAAEIEFSNAGAIDRLYGLSEKSYLEYKKVGNSPAFWITESGEDYLTSNSE